jgi:signal transduction histidine kinase
LKLELKQYLLKNVSLLIGAAWAFTLAFAFSTYWSSTSSPDRVVRKLTQHLHRQERDFEKRANDTALILRLLSQNETRTEFNGMLAKSYGFFVYVNDTSSNSGSQLRYWNTQVMQPPVEAVGRVNENYTDSLPNGEFEIINRRFPWNDRIVTVVGLIPLYQKYIFENDYLVTNFAGNPYVVDRYQFSRNATAMAVKSSYGNTLYHLQPKSVAQKFDGNWLSLILQLLGTLLILFYLHLLADRVATRYSKISGILLLVGTLLLLRTLSYWLPIPTDLRKYELFDPAIYGSNFILKSLGDLLINSLLFFWVIIFARKHFASANPLRRLSDSGKQLITAVLIAMCLVVATIITANVVKSLVSDSKISFDVTNFFSLSVYSAVGFVVLCSIALGYFFLAQLLLQFIVPVTNRYPYGKYLAVTVTGLLLLSIRYSHVNLRLELMALLWLLLLIWLLDQAQFRFTIGKYPIGVLIFWLFFFSASMSSIIIVENRSKEVEQDRKKLARSQAVKNDEFTAMIVSIALSKYNDDFLADKYQQISGHIKQNNTSLAIIQRDSMISGIFQSFVDRFTLQIHFFDESRRPLSINPDSAAFDKLDAIYNNQGIDIKIIKTKNVRFYESATNNYWYISKREMRDTLNNLFGTAFFIAQPRTALSEQLYPEIIRPRRQGISPSYNTRYSWASYDSLSLVKHYNEYPFPIRVDAGFVREDEFWTEKKGDYDILWYKSNGKNKDLVAVAKKDNFFIEAITLFAYLFCGFVFIVFIFRAINILLQSRFRLRTVLDRLESNIRTQVHSTIIFVSLFSFIIIGFVTINFFVGRYKRNNYEKLSSSISILNNDLKEKFLAHHSFNDGVSVGEIGISGDMQQLIRRMAEVHTHDINIFDTLGHLIVSSQPLIYKSNILNEQMHPEAFYQMKRERKVHFLQQESVGGLMYESIYMPVINDSLQVEAYANIPQYSVQSELQQEISNFLVTIINLNAFIFLIAGVIALFITNRITRSFSFISEKMRQISLSGVNEAIEWKREDEIGELVKEYNKMVAQLEESAAALAKSEREGAWREMARQVAHEIKNPLTPMKLSIQYLQKAIQNNSADVKQLSSSVAATLVEQIDHLSKIASDFSQFANISNTHNEVFDVHEVLNSLTALYAAQDDVSVQWMPPPQRTLINADKTQINRLFTNLIQNAIQAMNGEQPLIRIQETLKDKTVLISVSDNGTGIPAEMQSRIFMPNFTTKSSGAGLGLAMCKSIVEQAHGEIWFKTWPGEGTTFYVELPVAG